MVVLEKNAKDARDSGEKDRADITK